MNDFLRSILIHKIEKALRDGRLASKIEHSTLTGRLREILLEELIKPLLNTNYSVGTNCKVIDYKGTLSNELDICIYSNHLHPPFFFSENKNVGIFPIESVLKCIEVKSTFNKKELLKAYNSFLFLENNLIMSVGIHDHTGDPVPHIFTKPKYEFFAYNYPSNHYTPETILNIYKQIDPNWESDPLIGSICIANKGWIIHSSRGWFHRAYDTGNKINEEIIGYLCTLVQDLPNTERYRGNPHIGYYLFDTSEMDKLKKGKKIKNTWRGNSIKFSNTAIEIKNKV